MKVYGLAFIKNGEKFDYPYIESLQSLSPLVEEIYVNVGICDDGTRENVEKVKNVKIFDVEWDDNRSDRGHILSDMTNLVLNKLRREKSGPEDSDSWVIYLQSDEVIHESEERMILEDIKRAQELGHDCVRFRYLHFLGSHNKVALHKRWYPQEIRAIKLQSDILSLGDAQTFENYTNPFESDAHIYHYGHVRDEVAYKQKMKKFHTYYNSGFHLYRKNLKRLIKDFLRNDELTSFYGDHPKCMQDRIKRIGGTYIAPEVDEVAIWGDLSNISSEFIEKINARKVLFNQNGKINVYMEKFRNKASAEYARDWTPEFRLLMALSDKGVGIKKG